MENFEVHVEKLSLMAEKVDLKMDNLLLKMNNLDVLNTLDSKLTTIGDVFSNTSPGEDCFKKSTTSVENMFAKLIEGEGFVETINMTLMNEALKIWVAKYQGKHKKSYFLKR